MHVPFLQESELVSAQAQIQRAKADLQRTEASIVEAEREGKAAEERYQSSVAKVLSDAMHNAIFSEAWARQPTCSGLPSSLSASASW